MADDSFTTALVPSVSIENLVAQRDATIKRVRQAHELLVCVEDAGIHVQEHSSLGKSRQWTLNLVFSNRCGTFTDERGVELATKKIDAGYWSYLLSESGLQSFLDATARAKWRDAIDKEDVPELTLKNVEATFSALYAARGAMFERGVDELFRKLNRVDYKTNLYSMLGKRIILTYTVERWHGSKETSGVAHRAADNLDDLLRVMSILDGKPEPDHRNASYHTLNNARWMRDGGPSVCSVHGYFELKGYKNGNAHLTFLRLDLVEQMNRIIAKLHPDALPAARNE